MSFVLLGLGRRTSFGHSEMLHLL